MNRGPAALMLLLTLLSLALFVASLIHPLLHGEASRTVGGLLGRTCHRFPHRSLRLPWGTSGLCARCSAFWLACGLGGLAVLLGLPPPGLTAGLLMLFPLAVDGGLQYLGLYESTNFLRVATGLAAGAGVALLYGRLALRVSCRWEH